MRKITTKSPQKPEPKAAFAIAVPEELGVPPDPLRMRLDFHHQLTTLTFFDNDKTTTRVVDAMDIAQALANDLTYGSGLLPENTLWWINTRSGPLYALYEPPAIHKLALEYDVHKEPRRFTIPLPGLIFLCRSGLPPYVFAVKGRPTKNDDIFYKAPLCNIFTDGRSCGGNTRYPERVTEIPRHFLSSFFSATAELSGRSKKHPKNIVALWKELDGKKEYPLDDLVEQGQIYQLAAIR